MEEPEKKVRKTSSTKENATVKKTTTRKKATKTPKASTAKKTTKETKASSIKKEMKEPKKSTTTPKTKKTVSVDDEKKQNKKVEVIKEIDKNKKASAKENKPEQKKEEQENKKEKKRIIEISIGTILAVIIIALLIVLNAKLAKHAYNVTKEKFTLKNEVIDVGSEIDDEQEVGTVLNNRNETVTKLIEKITLAPNATASIYQTGTFDKTTIPNDLKLRLGWAKIKDENKLRAKKSDGESIIAAEEQMMQESIQNIFGSEIEYVDESFDNTNVSSFAISSENQGMINYSNNLYTGTVVQIKEEVPLIYQEVQKVVEYDDRIMIYVKTAFIDVKDGKYIIYKKHNEGFNNALLEVTPEELFGDTTANKYTGEGTVIVKSNENSVINNIRNQLNTYTYTFTLDNSTNEYCLSGFNV